MVKISKEQAIDRLWRLGELSWKIDPCQTDLDNLYLNSKHKTMTWLLSRRFGKSRTLCMMSLRQCIKTPKSIVKYVAPTKTQVNLILRPLMDQLLHDCPEDIKPVFREKDYIYFFPNGSEIQLAGSESNHAEKLRGGDTHLAIVDEAGDVSKLKYIITSILLPTTLTTSGKIIIAGTPPKEEDHDFLKVIEEADLKGSLIKRTIDDNTRLNIVDRQELIDEMGGIASEQCRRELFCEIVKSEQTSVIPEFTDALRKRIVKEWKTPPFYDCYVSMDLGYNDLTAVIYGYFDFRANKIIIEDEIAFNFKINDNHIKTLANLLLEKEKTLWFNPLTNELKKPLVRVSDVGPMTLGEISQYTSRYINFSNAIKYDKIEAISNLRVLLNSEKIIINPKCVTLIRHLNNVRWKSSKYKTEFARSQDDSHFDMVDALLYLIRAISLTRNPYPRDYQLGLESGSSVHINNRAAFQNNTVNVYRKLFGKK